MPSLPSGREENSPLISDLTDQISKIFLLEEKYVKFFRYRGKTG